MKYCSDLRKDDSVAELYAAKITTEKLQKTNESSKNSGSMPKKIQRQIGLLRKYRDDTVDNIESVIGVNSIELLDKLFGEDGVITSVGLPDIPGVDTLFVQMPVNKAVKVMQFIQNQAVLLVPIVFCAYREDGEFISLVERNLAVKVSTLGVPDMSYVAENLQEWFNISYGSEENFNRVGRYNISGGLTCYLCRDPQYLRNFFRNKVDYKELLGLKKVNADIVKAVKPSEIRDIILPTQEEFAESVHIRKLTQFRKSLVICEFPLTIHDWETDSAVKVTLPFEIGQYIRTMHSETAEQIKRCLIGTYNEWASSVSGYYSLNKNIVGIQKEKHIPSAFSQILDFENFQAMANRMAIFTGNAPAIVEGAGVPLAVVPTQDGKTIYFSGNGCVVYYDDHFVFGYLKGSQVSNRFALAKRIESLYDMRTKVNPYRPNPN